jgi:mannose-6-phosphate isomerase-like protein (cupin superfamily)
MSEPTNESSASERIERFINAVDKALIEGGMGADERQNVAADLRVQIEEMLSDRTRQTAKPVAVEDVEAVLAELDPPESYSEAAQPKDKESEKTDSSEHGCEGHWRRRGGAFYRGRHRAFWAKHRVAQAVRQAIRSFSPFGHPAFLGMTERSRTAVSLAKAEAQRMRHDFIGTEHLLLGLILEGSGQAAKTLQDLGIDREWAREEAARLVNPGSAPVVHERLPLTPRLRQAIENAHSAARNLGHDFLGTEHLLLGLLDVPGVAMQIITNRGLTSAQVRAAILARLPGAAEKSSVPSNSPAPFTYWPASAIQECRIAGNSYKIVAGGTDTGGAYAAIEAVIASPDGLGARTHTCEDISIYVLEGSVRLRIGDRMMDIAKGDFARIPRGTSHEIRPVTQPARITLIATPAGMEKLIAEFAKTPDTAQQHEIAQRYGVAID